jgi:dihydroxyacid dehydratase/phosphogluconate dehydratase
VTVQVWECLSIQVTPDTPGRYIAWLQQWSLGGIDLALDDFDRIGSRVPLLSTCNAGRFLMDDFYRAGKLLAVLREVRDLLDPTAVTVTGRPLVDYLDAAPIWDPEDNEAFRLALRV